jgi:hypothetical protein
LLNFSFSFSFNLQDKIRIKSKEEFEKLNKGFSHCLRALIEETIVQQLGHSIPGILEKELAEVCKVNSTTVRAQHTWDTRKGAG